LPDASEISRLSVDREGRLLAAISRLYKNPICSVARLDRSGVLDPTFGTGGFSMVFSFGAAHDSASAVIEMADGTIWLGGLPELSGSPAIFGITPDGRDHGARIVPPDVPGPRAKALALMDQGGALVVGYGPDYGFGDDDVTHLVRYTASGELDPSFPVIPAEGAVAMAQDGGIVMGNGALDGGWQFVVRRVTRDGEPDPSFGGGAPVAVPGVAAQSGRLVAVAPTAAGGMILAGVAHDEDDLALLVARFSANGQLDPSFAGGSGVALLELGGFEDARSVVEAADGGIVVVGTRCDREGDCRATAVRLVGDGSLDEGFGDDGVVVVDDRGSVFNSVVALPDGDIIAGGSATLVNEGYDPSGFLPDPLTARFPAR
jgi:uncharacterized delta-60 repeat protein